MWARWCEIVLAAWLLASPALSADPGFTTVAHLLGGGLTLLLAAASFRAAWRRAHLGILAVGTGLMVHGWLLTRGIESPGFASQNEISVGMLLAMFAVVPPAAFRTPVAWRHIAERQPPTTDTPTGEST